MAYLGTAGDTSNVQEEEMNQERGFGVLPAGWYRCALIEDEAKTYDWGTGLNMQFQILTGKYENRRVFKFLCVQHRKENVEHIARVQLKELATAAGHKNPDHVEETDVLKNKPIMVELYRGKVDDPKYAEDDGKRTEIGQFMSVDRWKAEKSEEPTHGIEQKSAPQPPSQANTPGDIPAEPDWLEDNPFN